MLAEGQRFRVFFERRSSVVNSRQAPTKRSGWILMPRYVGALLGGIMSVSTFPVFLHSGRSHS